MRYALFEPNPFEEDECQEMEIAVKNMVKLKKITKKDTRPTDSHDILGMMLYDIFVKLFHNETEFQIYNTEVVY